MWTPIKSKIIQIAGPHGAYALSRWLTRASPKIVMYHRFSEHQREGFLHREAFDRQVKYLKRNFNILRCDEVLEGLATRQLGVANAVVITVDDGYSDFYEIAYPVLKKYGVSATLFVVTRFIDGDFWLWPDRLEYVLVNSEVIESLDVPGFDIDYPICLTDPVRRQIWEKVVSYLLSIGEEEKNLWIESFIDMQKVTIPECPPKIYKAISWAQANELTLNNIEIGAHSRTHPSLGRTPDDLLAFEIEGAVDDIEKQIGTPPRSFCYPNGQPSDYSDRVKAHVRKAGCRGAVTAFYDSHTTDDLYEMRRFSAGEDWFQFVKAVNGMEMLSARWLNSTNKR